MNAHSSEGFAADLSFPQRREPSVHGDVEVEKRDSFATEVDTEGVQGQWGDFSGQISQPARPVRGRPIFVLLPEQPHPETTALTPFLRPLNAR